MLNLYMPSVSNLQTTPRGTRQANNGLRRDDTALLLSHQQLFAFSQTASMLRFPGLQDRRFNAEALLQLSLIDLLNLLCLIPISKDDWSIKNVNVRNTKLMKLLRLRVRQTLIV